MSKVKENISKILSKLPQGVSIMAVIKYASQHDIKELLDDGRIRIIGENRVQDAIKRWEKGGIFSNYRSKISLHFIGHLQKNKVKYAVKLFDFIDSVDSVELAREINKKTQKKMPILLQLKINNSQTQYGIKPEEFDSVFHKVLLMENISPCGIMAIAPNTTDQNEIRNAFKIARQFYEKYFPHSKNKDGFPNYLSIGMSMDFEIALKEGSNLLRLGSILFKS
ncbi:MAG: YggS family pyridoxal phosphate-dependent enzyme [Elusimicrobiales bacterium]